MAALTSHEGINMTLFSTAVYIDTPREELEILFEDVIEKVVKKTLNNWDCWYWIGEILRSRTDNKASKHRFICSLKSILDLQIELFLKAFEH